MAETPIRDCELEVDLHTVIGPGGTVAECATADFEPDVCEANAGRLAACWNAMRGVEDPAQFVRAAVEIAEYFAEEGALCDKEPCGCPTCGNVRVILAATKGADRE